MCDDTIRISTLLSMSLHGKIAVITGAGSGIGRGFAVAFVKEGTRVEGVKWLGDSAFSRMGFF